MKRRYRVLHSITSFSQSSGAAENTKLTLNLLDRTRFEPFLATAPGQSMDLELARDVVRIPLRWLRRPVSPFADVRALIELQAVIRHFGFDVVHTHNAKDGILARWAARLARVPVVVHTIHNVSFRASRSRLANGHYAMQERWAARFTNRLVTVSKENAREYLRHRIGREEQYRTVYSGLELSRYQSDGRSPAALRAGLALPDRSGPWAAWLGRFNPQKDPLTFVRAARLIANEIPGIQFVVGGDDPIDQPLEAETRSLATTVGLGDSMHFIGFRRDVSSVLRSVDVLVHSSRYEGMGRVICEALACERPVAGTAVDGVVEVVESGRRGGLLVRPGDPEQLANATIRLLRDREYARALAQAGHDWVMSHLSVERMVREIEQIYDEHLH